MRQNLSWIVSGITFFSNYRDYIANKSQTIDRSVTQTSIVVGISLGACAYFGIKKLFCRSRFLFFMKAHVNNSYIRKFHNQRNINCEKYVRKFWDFASMILLEKTFLAWPFIGRVVDVDGDGF